MVHEEYVEAVLSIVERIPPGRVMSYGAVSEWVRERTGRGSPRVVGNVMARYGGAVPWYRVVAGNGRLPPGHELEAFQRLTAEGVPFRNDKVDMARAAWYPGD
jgi:alkylated DNA nucleotide flippase Atl1